MSNIMYSFRLRLSSLDLCVPYVECRKLSTSLVVIVSAFIKYNLVYLLIISFIVLLLYVYKFLLEYDIHS